MVSLAWLETAHQRALDGAGVTEKWFIRRSLDGDGVARFSSSAGR